MVRQAKSVQQQRRSLTGRLTYGLGSVLVALAAVALASQWLFSSQTSTFKHYYEQSSALSSATEQLLESMLNQETGLRGYALGRQERFLEPYVLGQEQYRTVLADCRRLATQLSQELPASGALLPIQVDEVDRVATLWRTYAQEQISIQRKYPNRSITATTTGEGKLRFDRFRRRLKQLKQANALVVRQLSTESDQRESSIAFWSVVVVLLALGSGVIVALSLLRDLRRPLDALQSAVSSLAEGDLETRVPTEITVLNNELSLFASTFNRMAEQLALQTQQLKERDVLNSLGQLDRVLVEQSDLGQLGQSALEKLCELADVQLGALYLVDADRQLELLAGFGLLGHNQAERLQAGEGPAGLALLKRQPVILNDDEQSAGFTLRMPGGVLQLRSISAWPLLNGEELVGVLVLAGVLRQSIQTRNLLSTVSRPLAVALSNGLNLRKVTAARTALEVVNRELELQQSELQTVNEELERQSVQIDIQNRELLEADRKKDSFFASMSHELRTPLNSIIGFSQLLLRNKSLLADAQARLQLERVLENGKKQLRLVNDILDLSKIQSGALETEYICFEVEPFIQECIAPLSSLADEKELQVEVAIEPGFKQICSDRFQLATILTNLLSNAIKYTERGKIVIAARPVGTQFFELSVRDSGIGIPPQEQQMVFDEYRRLEGAATRQTIGTGLGLAICKRLVTLMGGEIFLDSTLGVGSTFIVQLPNTPAEEAPRRVSPPKVLFIDGNPLARQLLISRLAGRSLQLFFSANASEGLAIARSEGPQVIVIDPALERTNLAKLLFELHIDPATTSIPVVLHSVDEANLSIPLGLIDYLRRPVGQESLLALLRKQQILTQGRPILIVDDDEDGREFLAACLRDEGYTIQVAISGQEALACIERDLPQLLILDLMMPGMDGFEVLKRVRRMDGGAGLPIIILTALDLSDAQRQMLSDQSSPQVLIKGEQTIDELLVLLEQLLGRIAAGETQI